MQNGKVQNRQVPSTLAPLLLLSDPMRSEAFWQPLPNHTQASACRTLGYRRANSLLAVAVAVTTPAAAPVKFPFAGQGMNGRVASQMSLSATSRVRQLMVMGTVYLPQGEGAAGDAEPVGRMALIPLYAAKQVPASRANLTVIKNVRHRVLMQQPGVRTTAKVKFSGFSRALLCCN